MSSIPGVEHIKSLIQIPRKNDAELISLCRQLTTPQGQALAAYAIGRLHPDYNDPYLGLNPDEEALLEYLACFVPDAFHGMHDTLLQRHVYHPAEMYRGANKSVSRRLLNLLQEKQSDDWDISRIVYALGWIADSNVVTACLRWRDIAPEWSQMFYISWRQPADWLNPILKGFGWHLTSTGEQRFLYSHDSYAIVPMEHQGNPQFARIYQTFPQNCPACGQRLVLLFDFDLHDPRATFLKLSGSRLRIVTCLRCNRNHTLYMRVDTEGQSEWSVYTGHPPARFADDTPYTPREVSLGLGTKNRTPYEACWWKLWMGLSISQIGGLPTWYCHEKRFSTCPECQQPMPFVGQLLMSDVFNAMPGLLQAFLCRKCLIAATVLDSRYNEPVSYADEWDDPDDIEDPFGDE